jgi:AcrR family transcriptional regulator
VPAARLSRDEKKAITRKRLIEAAADVFAHRGFAATSVDEIAEKAGFSKGAVYSNFDSKEDLFLAVLDEHLHDQIYGVRRRLFEGTRPTGERLVEAGQLVMQMLQRERTWYLLSYEFLAYAARNTTFQEKYAARQRAQRELTASIIREDAESLGIRPPMPPERLAIALLAVANGIAFEKLADPDAVPDDLLGELFALLWSGQDVLSEPRQARSPAST